MTDSRHIAKLQTNDSDVVENVASDIDARALLRAVSRKKTEKAFKLIKAGVDLEVVNYYGSTALVLAAMDGLTDVVQALINAAANVNVVTTFGQTPLFFAVCGNHTKIAEMLIEAGANVSVSDNQGSTALLKAVLFNLPKLCEILLCAGADIDAANIFGDTALMLAKCLNRHSIVPMLAAVTQRNAAMAMVSRLRYDHSSFFSRMPKDILDCIIRPMVRCISVGDPGFTNTTINVSP